MICSIFMPHKLLILDFGSQYTQLIARRVRECGVYSEIHPWDMSDDDIREFGPSGVILSGGPESVNLDDPPRAPQLVFELGVPVLGICYGMQTMAAQLGGKVEASIASRVRLCRDRADRVSACSHGLQRRGEPRDAQGLDEPRRSC